MNEEDIIEKLSPLEIKVIPYLKLPIQEIEEKAELDRTSLLRALKFLENKGIIKLKTEKTKIIDLGTNGIFYKKNHLPERALLSLLEKNNRISLEDAKKLSKLSDNEFKVSLGVLKGKAMIELKEGKIILTAKKEELTKKTLEESFIESLPLEESSLAPEKRLAFQNLLKRKDIIELTEKTEVAFDLTEIGEKLAGRKIESNLLEEVTPEIINNWKKGQQFRKYDIQTEAPKLFGGKKHFVSESIEKGKRIWLDLGFKEMTGTKVQTSFWNFDALFTSQDHPVREMHDTFFIKNVEGKLPEKKIVERVKQSHEKGVAGSKGWDYSWNEDEAKRVVLRTHTTSLSAHALAKLKKEEMPAKFFAIGRNFRNETVDWSHGFEFNQTEGIVVDPNANFRNLLGYIKEFAKKMGYEKVKFQPSYFPYTEPSVEGYVWNEERKQWMEVLAAGIFRPEVTEPLLGAPIPVLAWGPGFDRLMMMVYKISDLREVYKNDIKFLRERRTQTN
jgi:phenylalanyl-tRNA synthetase alpha chain